MSFKPNSASAKVLDTIAQHSLRNFNYKRLQKIANLQLTSRPAGRVFCDESQYLALRDTSNLGPGYYNTQTTSPGPSYNFGYSIRFRNSPSPILPNSRSTNIIKNNKKMQIHTPEFKKLKLEKQISQKRLRQCISREAKRIITIEKRNKLKEQIDEKFNKTEIIKLKKLKMSIGQSFSTLLAVFCVSHACKTRLHKRREYYKKIQKNLYGIAVIFRAIGKFMMSLKNGKVKIALRVIQRIMPQYVRRFKGRLRTRHLDVISDVFENFSKYVSIAKINFMVNLQIKKIQRMIRSFLCVMRYRKHALRIMWNRLDYKVLRVPENVQHFYISSYLLVKMSDFVQKQSNIHKYITFLTSDEKALVKFKEMKKIDRVEKPILRIFLVQSIKRLITKAYEEKNRWNDIGSTSFPIPLEKKLVIELKRGTVFKAKKFPNKAKRGTVTFKLAKGD